MRTTLNLDEDLLKQAAKLTKVKTKTDLIHLALRTLIASSAQEQLALLGGIDKKAKAPSRRRVS